MLIAAGLLAGGLLVLIVGAEILVRGASRLAIAFGISPLVVGLTVVAFGTSSPEFAVCIGAAWTGQADIAMGNVVGSSIFNVLFILGLSALLTPLLVAQRLVWLDVPLMVAATVVSFLLALDGRVGRVDGALLFAGLAAYLVFQVRQSRQESAAILEQYAREYGPKPEARRMPAWLNLLLMAAGLGMLVLGSDAFVEGAVLLARHFGVSELIIGLTIVAIGTSLPEVATSVVAGLRGERDIAVGNIVGSNLFNILGVLGLTALVAPDGVAVAQQVLDFDLPVMIAVAVACLPIFFSGHTIARWEGGLFFAYYLLYTGYLALQARHHQMLPVFSDVMLWFVIPLTFVTLAVLAAGDWRARRSR